jgi:hypothetical protein
MAKNRGSFRDGPFYLLIFSAYPALSLLATNIREVDVSVVWRPLAASILFACLSAAVLQRFYQLWANASLGATILLVLFFFHGHLIRLAAERYPEDQEVAGSVISAACVVVLIASLYAIGKTKTDLAGWNAGLNVFAIVLIVFPMFNVVSAAFATTQGDGIPAAIQENDRGTVSEPGQGNPESLPDIYYILLDGYSRADTLEAMGYDNTLFIESLEQMGFYVATCSRSNYRSTLLSMPAIFNMEYLHDFLPDSGREQASTPLLSSYLVHNRVRTELENRGYTVISFETGYQWNEWTDADYYLAPDDDSLFEIFASPSLTQFEYIFLNNTALAGYVQNSKLGTTRYNDLYTRVNFTLEKLPEVISVPGPKFVYAHILSPHYPFIFLPDGSLNTDARYFITARGTPDDPELTRIGYINNVKFINTRLPGILQLILQNSGDPPVIIIQGDHGHVIPERRFNTLSAFYLPGSGADQLYPEISSVNTFRVVFNEYFDGTYEILEDTSFDADIGNPYLEKSVEPFPETCK